MRHPICTIGYEGKSLESLFESLKAAGVTCLVDVRIRPQSRKPGFSKSSLAENCSEHGIDYVHRRDLGTPEYIMKQLRETGVYNWEAYSKHLSSEKEALQWLTEVCQNKVSCLLCFEREAADCHRKIIADEVASSLGATVKHLQ